MMSFQPWLPSGKIHALTLLSDLQGCWHDFRRPKEPQSHFLRATLLSPQIILKRGVTDMAGNQEPCAGLGWGLEAERGHLGHPAAARGDLPPMATLPGVPQGLERAAGPHTAPVSLGPDCFPAGVLRMPRELTPSSAPVLLNMGHCCCPCVLV